MNANKTFCFIRVHSRSFAANRFSTMDRRAFLQLPALGAFAAADSDGWFNRPMRWSQLTLVENDPGAYDPKFWLDYFRRTHSDAACLSAGGCVAYYPTSVPLHYRSKWLGNGSAFGDMGAGCRQLKMMGIAGTEPHAAPQDAFGTPPDWVSADAMGK